MLAWAPVTAPISACTCTVYVRGFHFHSVKPPASVGENDCVRAATTPPGSFLGRQPRTSLRVPSTRRLQEPASPAWGAPPYDGDEGRFTDSIRRGKVVASVNAWLMFLA